MNSIDEDLDDSALLCESLIPKRKAFRSINSKNSKQMKFTTFASKKVSKNDANIKGPVDVLTEEDETSQTSHCDSKRGEASNYFSQKLSTCPLCLKSFKTESVYATHMKQCAKTRKMTTQQLLEALELQKKQMQERKALGLRSMSLPSPKKQPARKKTDKKMESYDLALGLALSKSLATCDSKTSTSQEVTLEEFGFTSRNGGVCRRKEKEKKSLLKQRTSDERQRIIVEKVAVVLLDDEEQVTFGGNEVKGKSFQSTQVPKLWNLGENNEKRDWYVTGIKTLMLLEENNTQEERVSQADVNQKLSELNLPQKEFHECWKRMINNSIKSDLIGRTKDDKNVYLHSLVLFTRCPEVLENDFESTFQKFNLSTVLIFLEYLYCGTLNSLIASEIDDLLELAKEVNFKELVLVLECLKSKLKSSSEVVTTPEFNNIKNEVEEAVVENEKSKVFEDKDLFSENNLIDLTQEGDSDESNIEKSYYSFIQHEKKRLDLVVDAGKEINEKLNMETFQLSNECKTNSKTVTQSENLKESEMKSNDSATGDLCEDAKTKSDCIILSSGSEPQSNSKIPSPMDYEAPFYDPYNDLHMFSEEPFSPVGLNSQSLLVGDISAESFKLSSPSKGTEIKLNNDIEEQKKTLGYCSTPVTVHQSSKIKSSGQKKYRKRRSDLSASRILRKSLGLQQKKTPRSSKKSSFKKKGNPNEIVETIANSVLQELSKSSTFQKKNFVEITPLQNREEFRESDTPSPNYSLMGESVLKEQLTRYGLKKNLAKSKAKKILRHIYEELHPLYNTETGKIVKMLPSNTPKTGKAKPKKTNTKNTKKSKNSPKKISNDLNTSKESQNMSDETIGPTQFNSDGSEFEDLNETLTQSIPSNPVDLPSAFCEYLQNNPDYHQKILLYEPIWLEELQKNLKETYKKHFKISDLMDYLDQTCITFRSAAQVKKLQARNQKKCSSKKKSPR